MRGLIAVLCVASLLLVLAITGCGRDREPAQVSDEAEPATSMLARWDADKDGKLSREEFKGPEAEFKGLDGDSDGVLTAAEVEKAAAARETSKGQAGAQEAGAAQEGSEAAAEERTGRRERAGADRPARRQAQRSGPEPEQRWDRMLEQQDANKDGEISKEELKGSEEVLGRLDEDRDGKLTREEFIQGAGRGGRGFVPGGFLMRGPDKNGDERISRQEWRGFFTAADGDKDGYVTPEELQEQMREAAASRGSGEGRRSERTR